MSERATFATRLGGIAAAVGSAVGFGNIWRFPYITGRDGGAAFLLIYIVAVLLLGIPMMIAEFSIGRSAHRNVVGAYRMAAPGTQWHWVGMLGLLVAVLILGFYTVLSGWTLRYTFVAISGNLHADEFMGFVSDTYQPLFWTLLAIFINATILFGGVQKGIERASNIMMPVLAILLLVLVGNSFFQEGFAEGVSFLFVPKWEDVTVQTFLDAIGQAFFSLSVAMGILVAYGSYLGDNTKIGKTAISVAVLDTLVALLAGVVIFPACFTYHQEAGQGPGLMFETLPTVFEQMPGGWPLGAIFFLLITLAGLTSCMSIFEVPISYLQEEWHMSRRRATVVSCFYALAVGICCSLAMGVWSDFKLSLPTAHGWEGYNLFDFLDNLTSRYMMPICAILTSIMVGWYLKKDFMHDAITNWKTDSGWYLRPLLILLRFVAPALILVIFVANLL